MGGVNISPNIKKSKAFIDTNGNEVKPYTKEIVKPIEPDYVPPKVETKTIIQPQTDSISKPSPIAAMIKSQIQEAVLASVKQINIKEIVDEAIREALK